MPGRHGGSVQSNTIKPMSYFEVQGSCDLRDLLEFMRGGFTGYRRSGFVESLSDAVVDIVVGHCEDPPFPGWSVAFDHYLHGEIWRVPQDTCAFNLRVPGFRFRVAAFRKGSVSPDAVKIE